MATKALERHLNKKLVGELQEIVGHLREEQHKGKIKLPRDRDDLLEAIRSSIRKGKKGSGLSEKKVLEICGMKRGEGSHNVVLPQLEDWDDNCMRVQDRR